MCLAAFLPCPTPTVTVRSLGTMSPPAKTPGHPVINEEFTLTVPSDSNSTPGSGVQESGLGDLPDRHDHGVRRQRLEAPGRLREAVRVQLHDLDLQFLALEGGDGAQPVDPHALALTRDEVYQRLEELERLLWRRVLGQLRKVAPGASVHVGFAVGKEPAQELA